MERTPRQVSLEPQRWDARPKPLVELGDGPTQLPRGYNEQTDGGLYLLETSHDAGHYVIVPPEWFFWQLEHPELEEGADWRDYPSHERCLKTTAIHEQLASNGATHPRLLSYAGSDPRTRFPLLHKISHPISMDGFIDNYAKAMYRTKYLTTETRIQPAFLPLIYQWVLHAVSALSFLHSNDIMIGEFSHQSFLLSFPSRTTAPEIFFVCFPDACYRSSGGEMIQGAEYPCSEFATPLRDIKHPTRVTDSFLLGNVIYKLMTGYFPDEAWKENPNGGLGPPLEDEYLGMILKKCWSGEYGGDLDALKIELAQFLKDRGYVIGAEGDIIQNLVMGELAEPEKPGDHAWLLHRKRERRMYTSLSEREKSASQKGYVCGVSIANSTLLEIRYIGIS